MPHFIPRRHEIAFGKFVPARSSHSTGLVGERHGYLTIIAEATRDQRNLRRVLCRCDCGKLLVVYPGNIRSGNTKSCGCHRGDGRRRHGHTIGGQSPTFKSWLKMRERCNNPTNFNYQWYGGRGISICSQWLNSFQSFLDDMGERPPGQTLDRIDPDGNYEPSNCRWATSSQQRANQRRV